MRPVSFQVIEEAALLRHGGAALQARLALPRSTAELAALGDDRYLSAMTRRIFQAGLKHDLVDKKWPAFEEVFKGFDPAHVAGLYDEDLEAMLADTRLIRHMAKLQATRHNAGAMLAIAKDHGSFAAWLANWPISDITGLWAALARTMKQLGGNSAPAFLRMVGKDTFVLTTSVINAVNHWQAATLTAKGKADHAALQAVFNRWHEETGKPICQVSQILAMSID